MTHITIGVLAHNEADVIGDMLDSLLSQSVFQDGEDGSLAGVRYDLIVIANGCDDGTADRAQHHLAQASGDAARLHCRVVSLPVADKCSAWNHLVHHAARPETEVFVLIDADIVFDHRDTVANCLSLLRAQPALEAVVDTPRKRFGATSGPGLQSLLAHVSMRLSGCRGARDVGICGQFYCARATALRSLWLPAGLCGEDGFLNAMIVTQGLRLPARPQVVARASGASHHFQGLSRWRDIVRHEIRLVLGELQNEALTRTVLPEGAGHDASQGLGAWMRAMEAREPDWCSRRLSQHFARQGRWRIPRHLWFRRFRGLGRLGSWRARLLSLPYRGLATVFDWAVFGVANHRLKRQGGLRYW